MGRGVVKQKKTEIIHKNNRMKRATSFTVTMADLVLNINIRYEDIFLLAS
jgi:hypothetical protein